MAKNREGGPQPRPIVDLFLFEVESGVTFRVEDQEIAGDIAKLEPHISPQLKKDLEAKLAELPSLRIAVGVTTDLGKKDKAIRNLHKKHRQLFVLLGPLFKECFSLEKYPLHDQPLPNDWDNKQTAVVAAPVSGVSPAIVTPEVVSAPPSIKIEGDIHLGFDDKMPKDPKNNLVITLRKNGVRSEVFFSLLRNGVAPVTPPIVESAPGSKDGQQVKIIYPKDILILVRKLGGVLDAELLKGTGNKPVYGSRLIATQADLEAYFVGAGYLLKDPPEEPPPLPGTSAPAQTPQSAAGSASPVTPQPVDVPTPSLVPVSPPPVAAVLSPSVAAAPSAAPKSSPAPATPDVALSSTAPDPNRREVPLIKLELEGARSVLQQARDHADFPNDLFPIKADDEIGEDGSLLDRTVAPPIIGEVYFARYWVKVFTELPPTVSIDDFLLVHPAPGDKARPKTAKEVGIPQGLVTELEKLDQEARAEARGSAYLCASEHIVKTTERLASTIVDSKARWETKGGKSHQSRLEALRNLARVVRTVAHDENAFYPAYDKALTEAYELMQYLYGSVKEGLVSLDKKAEAYFSKHPDREQRDEWRNRLKSAGGLRKTYEQFDKNYRQGDGIPALFSNFDSFNHQVEAYTGSVELLLDAEAHLEQLVGQPQDAGRDTSRGLAKKDSQPEEKDPRIASLMTMMYGDEFSSGKNRTFQNKFPFDKLTILSRRAQLPVDIWATSEVRFKTIQLAFGQAYTRRDSQAMREQYAELEALETELEPFLAAIKATGVRI